jgi:hypothetical protein
LLQLTGPNRLPFGRRIAIVARCLNFDLLLFESGFHGNSQISSLFCVVAQLLVGSLAVSQSKNFNCLKCLSSPSIPNPFIATKPFNP